MFGGELHKTAGAWVDLVVFAYEVMTLKFSVFVFFGNEQLGFLLEFSCGHTTVSEGPHSSALKDTRIRGGKDNKIKIFSSGGWGSCWSGGERL